MCLFKAPNSQKDQPFPFFCFFDGPERAKRWVQTISTDHPLLAVAPRNRGVSGKPGELRTVGDMGGCKEVYGFIMFLCFFCAEEEQILKWGNIYIDVLKLQTLLKDFSGTLGDVILVVHEWSPSIAWHFKNVKHLQWDRSRLLNLLVSILPCDQWSGLLAPCSRILARLLVTHCFPTGPRCLFAKSCCPFLQYVCLIALV